MKQFILVPIFLLSLSCHAWGPTGHRVTGLIAEGYLNKRAKTALEGLLGQSLAMASTWMDEVRSDSSYDYMVDWHWVTIPDGMTYAQTEKNPKGDVVEAIERIVKALKSRSLTRKQEIEHVKALIHLIGDIHQPLHVGTGTDRGGNEVKVRWFRTDSNLHQVWDSDMINDTRLSYTELANSLPKPTGKEVTEWQSASVFDWATESMGHRKSVYDIGNGKLEYEYSYYHFHIVRKRLLQAGIRIAGILNDIYGKS